MTKRIGRYELGIRTVELVCKDAAGGEFYMHHKPSGLARIVVGFGERSWGAVVGILLHEAYELAAADHGCRFNPAPDYSWDAANYSFAMTHQQFAEITARVGIFMSDCLPALSSAYNRRKKPAPKGRP